MKTLDASSKYTYHGLCPVGHWSGTIHTDIPITVIKYRCPHCGGATVVRHTKNRKERRMIDERAE